MAIEAKMKGGEYMLSSAFAALFAIVVIAISGLTFLYIENHRPVYYVEDTKKHTDDGSQRCAG